MSTPFKMIATGLGMAVMVSTIVAAQQPRIQNGTVTTQPAGSAFTQSFRSLVNSTTDASWIGYAVPVADGERVMCCFNGGTSFVNGTVSDPSGCCGLCRPADHPGALPAARRAP